MAGRDQFQDKPPNDRSRAIRQGPPDQQSQAADAPDPGGQPPKKDRGSGAALACLVMGVVCAGVALLGLPAGLNAAAGQEQPAVYVLGYVSGSFAPAALCLGIALALYSQSKQKK